MDNSIMTNLEMLQNIKTEIKNSIEEHSIEVDCGMIGYPDKIRSIPSAPKKINVEKNTKFAYSSFKNIPDFDTSEYTDMSYMFYACNNLTAIPEFDTSNVTNMSNMFFNCRNLMSIPEFDTSNVTNMSNMFYGCAAKSIPLLDASKVTKFKNVISAAGVELGGFKNLGMQKSLDTSSDDLYKSPFYGVVLSKTSVLNIFNNLYDRSAANYSAVTLWFDRDIDVTEEEIAIATNKGWIINWYG